MNYRNNKVYESPDGGKTIYEREIGSTERVMIREDTVKRDQVREQQLWHEIRIAAKTNVALADILKQAEMVYALIKEENN